MTETNHTDETIGPIDYLTINIGPDVGDNDALIKVRVIPVGRNGNKVIGKTLTCGETDSGDTITIWPGEKLLFPAGNINISIQDIDRENKLEPDGYAPISNTVWTWLQLGKPADPNLFRFLFAVARRLDTAHTLCVNAINELGLCPDEPYIQTRARIFKALGYAELMCVALNRATTMIKDIPSEFSVLVAVPNAVDTILPALKALRDAFEHIEERALGNVFRKPNTDALSIFDQEDFFSSGILRYANHSLELKAQVIPALISSRQFIFDVAVEKAGALITINEPKEFFS